MPLPRTFKIDNEITIQHRVDHTHGWTDVATADDVKSAREWIENNPGNPDGEYRMMKVSCSVKITSTMKRVAIVDGVEETSAPTEQSCESTDDGSEPDSTDD